MKRLLLTVCLLGGMIASAQTLQLVYSLNSNAPGTVISNQPVWVNVSNMVLGSQYYYTSSAGGQVTATIPHPGAATITMVTYDCQGNMISTTQNVTPNNTFAGDTVIVPCGFRLNCQALIHQISPNPSSLTVNLLDSSNVPYGPGLIHTSAWSFGDGNGSIGGSVSHTYGSAGTYTVCLISRVFDSINNIVLCDDTICMPITVGGTGGGNPFCNASYWVDTIGSMANNVNIYNSSTPLNSAAFQTTYLWDFGDGNTSTLAFPSHTYAGPGIYGVCLTITSVDANNNVCTDTYCDSLGVDSLGNLIYKTAAPFTLNVLDPASIGLKDHKILDAKLFPNPAADFVNVDLSKVGGDVNWKLYDLKGASLQGGNSSASQLTIDVSALNSGVYILSLETADAVGNYKLIVE